MADSYTETSVELINPSILYPTRKPWDGEHLECNRCANCCKKFTLPITPGQVEQMRKNAGVYYGNIEPYRGYKMKKSRFGPMQDWEVLVDMLIPLEQFRYPNGRFGPAWYYACKHVVDAVGDGRPGCNIYEDRPRVCSRFPYGRWITDRHLTMCIWHKDNKEKNRKKPEYAEYKTLERVG